MIPDLLQAAGGIGLFLLGMQLLTDGLRALAGDRLRQVLAAFTKSPVTGAATGAVTTALIQSSSATTMIAIGLVGAGLMSFPHALGIIFGANIGTTITGWLVAALGFKFKLGLAAMPLVLAGALLRVFASGRLARLGLGLAGFALLFIGIDMMQAGLAALEGIVTPDRFPADTLLGRFELVLIGIAITLVTQSSSAGVATALVALHGGAISFPQACAMVIGMDVGTTFKSAIVVLGGSTQMRRTGYAHVLYNLATGVMAFLLLPLYVWQAGEYLSAGGDAQFALVAFHTLFNALGVILVLPFTNLFARFVMRLVPEEGAKLVDRLDDRLLPSPSAALDAAIATLRGIALELAGAINALLAPNRTYPLDATRAAELRDALDSTRLFMERIQTDHRQAALHTRYLSAVHALDHLNRLLDRCEQLQRIVALRPDHRLWRLAGLLRGLAGRMAQSGDMAALAPRFDKLRSILRDQRHVVRERTIDSAAHGAIGTGTTLVRLDAVRWLHRTAYHLWRICHHLAIASGQTAPPAAEAEPVEEPALDREED
ncbi:MAG: Na/Pi cotransporter [Ahrensia sp.]|nr:Na/Pi cotransporter [Ahrensia sp.]